MKKCLDNFEKKMDDLRKKRKRNLVFGVCLQALKDKRRISKKTLKKNEQNNYGEKRHILSDNDLEAC